MRSVPGANFKFVWSLTGPNTTTAWSLSDAYPGNSYVDYVSEDIYDWSWSSSIFFPSGDPNNAATVAQSNAVFNQIFDRPERLELASRLCPGTRQADSHS